VNLTDLYRLPDGRPDIETVLEPGELITAIELPGLPVAVRSTYRKVRDRASYAFAVISVAAALHIEDGRVSDVRLALGGVAHRPWRAWAAEAALRGESVGETAFVAAADIALAGAQPLKHNGFKIELAKRVVVGVLTELAAATA
jgi:xanthine dehydrogenase YagS FAD-binding subunit